MTDSRAAALDMDRLPWLADERKPKRRRDWTPALLAAFVCTVLVAGVSFWLGTRTTDQGAYEPLPEVRRPGAATVKLPDPSTERQAVSVQPSPMREVEPVAAPPPVRIEVPDASRTVTKLRRLPSKKAAPPLNAPVSTESDDAAPAAAEVSDSPKVQAPVRPRKVEYWPSSESAGASGRMVRIGTFRTRLQAKKAWWRIVKVYPGMKKMNATVVGAPSLRNGRTYYRLQYGTTSQAHSEILCQRMRIVGQSCVVVGLAR